LGLAILIITLALTGFIANKRGPKTGQVKWADAILIITLALTGFIANKRGPKTGQVKWADLDALLQVPLF